MSSAHLLYACRKELSPWALVNNGGGVCACVCSTEKLNIPRHKKRKGGEEKSAEFLNLQVDTGFLFSVLFCFVWGQAHGVRTFPGQGSNLHHSSDQSHSSDHAGSLTAKVPRDSTHRVFCFLLFLIFVEYSWPRMCVSFRYTAKGISYT